MGGGGGAACGGVTTTGDSFLLPLLEGDGVIVDAVATSPGKYLFRAGCALVLLPLSSITLTTVSYYFTLPPGCWRGKVLGSVTQ